MTLIIDSYWTVSWYPNWFYSILFYSMVINSMDVSSCPGIPFCLGKFYIFIMVPWFPWFPLVPCVPCVPGSISSMAPCNCSQIIECHLLTCVLGISCYYSSSSSSCYSCCCGLVIIGLNDIRRIKNDNAIVFWTIVNWIVWIESVLVCNDWCLSLILFHLFFW